jgi:hypothetical protein
MADRCKDCDYWDKGDGRIPDTYATCKRVQGPDSPLNSLAFVQSAGARFVTRAEYGCVLFKPYRLGTATPKGERSRSEQSAASQRLRD